MGGFLGIGGASWKTDRGIQLDAMQKMKNVFNYALPQATGQQAAGTESLDKAGDYWKRLLSGNRTVATQAVAPETNAIRTGADARKRQLGEMGTARGGGVNEASQRLETDTAAKTDSAILGARPEAAKETASIGRTQLEDASRILGLGADVSTSLASEARLARKQDYEINQDMVGKVQQFVEEALAVAFA
jgi:hypothetical protein